MKTNTRTNIIRARVMELIRNLEVWSLVEGLEQQKGPKPAKDLKPTLEI